MATVHFHGEPAHTIGDLPALGTTLPNISLVDATLADITNDTIAGTRVIFNVFPSIDTGVCATSVRRFNEEAAGLDNTTVLAMKWDTENDETDGLPSLSSMGLPDGAVTTTIAIANNLEAESADLTEDEIDKTIAEIQEAIQRSNKECP